MNEISQTIKNYELIENDLKFLPKSMIRLKILKTLYESPMDMKEINQETKLNYSAISNIIHKLELDGSIYWEKNSYFLSNSMRLCIGNLFELDDLMLLLENISPIILNHNINSIPVNSLFAFHYLRDIHLIVSNGLDVYKTYELITNSIKRANSIHAILPFSYDEFNTQLNRLASKNRTVHLLSPADIRETLMKNLEIKNNLKIDYFNGMGTNYFLLICTDKKMILGFFRDDGVFDQNRILISSNKTCINWANELFENFKKEKMLNE
ncbi:MAG: DUF1724 domain-containing protein [Methanobrevibacter sp.]|uniref:transcriptional regulator FilR1 domain-containing protein n=1 Tax=Methanobrevibacter sp. TaxID=66852 RepID=UPI0025E052D1|nr:transcriptional regulator FilR1 domain-containing protein [Methanobrevibacter sp.]MBR0270642.1 DUF1724 domain-containing protein [Methanobrevibacter sp.]